MKRFSKICLALMLSVLLTFSVVVQAAESTPVYVAENGSTADITPRMSYLSAVFTDLTINGTKADVMGYYTIFKTYKVNLNVKVQYSADNSTWLNVPDESWTQSWSTTGVHTISRKTNNDLAHGYYYRTCTTATVVNSAGSPLETVIVYSVSSYYA